MKIIRVFGIVVVVHIVMAALFMKGGCTARQEAPAIDTTAPMGEQDPVVWDDMEDQPRPPAQEPRPRQAPTRPDRQITQAEQPQADVLRPLPGVRPEPPPAAMATTYTVRRGDSLWEIARRHNVSINALLDANRLPQNAVIQPGQELVIPAGGLTPAAPTRDPVVNEPLPGGATTYTVQRGDSLSRIAQRHGTTVAELRRLNNISGDTIRIGQRLVVPERRAGAVAPTPAMPAQRASVDGQTHVVQAGETPGAIAARYGISVEQLMQANNISDPRRLRVGQNLVIPGAREARPAAQPPAAPARVETPVRVPPIEPQPDSNLIPVPIIQDDPLEDDVPLIPVERVN